MEDCRSPFPVRLSNRDDDLRLLPGKPAVECIKASRTVLPRLVRVDLAAGQVLYVDMVYALVDLWFFPYRIVASARGGRFRQVDTDGGFSPSFRISLGIQ